MRGGGWYALMLAAAPLPVAAQDHGAMDHGQMGHGAVHHGHDMPPAADAANHAAHQPSETISAGTDPHAGHAMPPSGGEIPRGDAPRPPADHAADALYDPAVMARARVAMTEENGDLEYSLLLLDRLEYRAGRGRDGYHWQGEGGIGGDINRLVFKSEGEGEFGGPLETAEAQLLYSRALDPWFDLEVGVRHDFRPRPQRTYAVVGIEGLAPYWFEIGAHAFLSDKGDAHVRFEGSYDQRITQRLILQPAIELNAAAQDVREIGVGAGFNDIELGLRLRYEFFREFAPYVGVNWERKLGATADYARAAGEGASATNLVLGIRLWF